MRGAISFLRHTKIHHIEYLPEMSRNEIALLRNLDLRRNNEKKMYNTVSVRPIIVHLSGFRRFAKHESTVLCFTQKKLTGPACLIVGPVYFLACVDVVVSLLKRHVGRSPRESATHWLRCYLLCAFAIRSDRLVRML